MRDGKAVGKDKKKGKEKIVVEKRKRSTPSLGFPMHIQKLKL